MTKKDPRGRTDITFVENLDPQAAASKNQQRERPLVMQRIGIETTEDLDDFSSEYTMTSKLFS
jgi:hypothetical protein